MAIYNYWEGYRGSIKPLRVGWGGVGAGYCVHEGGVGAGYCVCEGGVGWGGVGVLSACIKQFVVGFLDKIYCSIEVLENT